MTAPDDEIQRRKNLTFEQAEGLAPLPKQLARTEVSQELRAVLWNYIHEEIQKTAKHDMWTYLGSPWNNILKQVHVYREHKLVDDFHTEIKPALTTVRQVFERGTYSDIYGWLQFVLRINRSREFIDHIAKILRYCRSPLTRPSWISRRPALSGSREHLKSASAELSAGNFSDSIRESIHAVESVVRVLEPSGDFSKALAKLESKAKIHGALVSGFKSVYGFTSDAQGIRHPLLDKEAPRWTRWMPCSCLAPVLRLYRTSSTNREALAC
jgi:hypothetical protein